MPISAHLLRKLEEALGHEAADDLVTQLTDIQSLRADVAELRHEMLLGFTRVDARFTALTDRIDTQSDKTTATLLKWSFVFWVGAVGAIAALAGVLR
jgi:hypothetical protein